MWFSPLERYLELIAAVALNTAGLSVLAAVTSRPAIIAGATAYGIGSVWWVMVASYRSTASVWAADRLASIQRLPDAFEALDGWMGLLFRLYILMAYGSELAVGAGLLQTELVPSWTA